MHGEQADINVSSNDASRLGLVFAHRLAATAVAPKLPELLGDLSAAFAADGAGVAALSGGPPLARRSVLSSPARWPWESDPSWRSRLRGERGAVLLPHPEGGSCFVIAVPGLATTGWLIWLESRKRTVWNTAENAAFVLAAAAVARTLDSAAAQGSEQLERLARQQQLEHAAAAVRRVAHDYGNVLTTILGFNELALTQPIPANSALHRYLKEVHCGAESGAELTQQLRLFSRRQITVACPCLLEPILVEEQTRLHAAVLRPTIELSLPPDLPPAAIDGDHLRTIVRALLENAVEATPQPGVVTLRARTMTIAADECLDYYGDVRPGPHVELRISDEGDGFKPEVQRRLFTEPFFSTKPRQRGYGLLAVYGVLHGHKGGLRLSNGPERGAVARVVLPVAVMPVVALAPVAPGRTLGARVLVVDDDPLLLRFVTNALTKGGYRVQAAENAAEALAAHAASRAEPFRLVLSDVKMPHVSGVELVRRLSQDDPDVRVLFMTGEEPGDDMPKEIAGSLCEVLLKPFRAEALLRTVRAVLERGPGRRTAVRPVTPRDESIVSSSR